MAQFDAHLMLGESRQLQPIARRVSCTLAACALVAASLGSAWGQITPGSLDVEWHAGASDCSEAQEPPLKVHRYDNQTYVLRQSLCADAEANFIYLLIGEQRAMLIDTGAVESPATMPLARTVMPLLDHGGVTLPLLVVHTHGHRDHRAGDRQFERLPSVEIRSGMLPDVVKDFGFLSWPEDTVFVDLGGRVVDVIPTPGHHPAHLVFYDRPTGIVISGDFLLPGRLLIDDPSAYQRSAERLSIFLESRPVSHVLGGHVEIDRSGRPYPMGSTHHPSERTLALTKEDVIGLASRLQDFNGFYAEYPNYILTNPKRNLAAVTGLLLVLAGGLFVAWRRWRRRRTRRRAKNP